MDMMNYINGEWVKSHTNETLDVINPATGQVIGHAAACEKADVDDAVKAARKAFDTGPWTKMTPSERGRIIWKVGDLILKYTEELAQLESIDNGKPISIARAADVVLAADIFHYMAGWATKIEGNSLSLSVPYTPGVEYQAFTRKEPVGVVGAIIPWNFPLLMAAWKIGPALAAGCTVVLKPAEETPLTALRLGELTIEAGIPPGVVNIVTGLGPTAGAALAAHAGIDKIAFTGSTEVGKHVQRAAVDNMTRVSLELGGKSPVIVLEDADPAQAAAGAANAIFFNQGQVCTAGSRLYVQRSAFDRVVGELSSIADKMKLGPGLDPSSELGPLVSTTQRDRVCGYIAHGVEQGARIAAGGGRAEGAATGVAVEPPLLHQDVEHVALNIREFFS